jgi:TPR repeat protein
MNQLARLSFSALPVATIVASGVIVLALFGVAAAGQLQDGVAAYQSGDYATAMRLLRPLADLGNAVAQSYLGDMYNFGEGVPQNYAQAVVWLRKAAEQGKSEPNYDSAVITASAKVYRRKILLAHRGINWLTAQ